MLVGLSGCTNGLKDAGNLAALLLASAEGVVQRVNVHTSTVRDCEAVACLKTRLAELRLPPSKTDTRDSHFIALEVVPKQPPRRLTKFDWSQGASAKSCVDAPDPEVSLGRLPPEVIQRTVRDRYSSFRICYEIGLEQDPKLQGRVTTRFVIGRDGRVSAAYLADVGLPDCRVARCVRDEMARLVFPKPAFGIVTVVYPIMFAPGDPLK
jgi:hypothetical protein